MRRRRRRESRLQTTREAPWCRSFGTAPFFRLGKTVVRSGCALTVTDTASTIATAAAVQRASQCHRIPAAYFRPAAAATSAVSRAVFCSPSDQARSYQAISLVFVEAAWKHEAALRQQADRRPTP